jgi:hypothetical protein
VPVAAAWDANPLTLLAGAAVVVAIYKVASGLHAPPQRWREAEKTPTPPVPELGEVGEITEEELRQYDGSDPEKHLLMAIEGQVYDVSESRCRFVPYALLLSWHTCYFCRPLNHSGFGCGWVMITNSSYRRNLVRLHYGIDDKGVLLNSY